MISGYERLDVWKLSHELALHLYKLSRQFPRDEKFGVTAQIRRAALAIPTNIAEGNARQHRKEYLQFCSIARGSLAELRYLLRFVLDMEFMTKDQYESLRVGYDRVGQMLNAMMANLRIQAKKQPHV